MFKKHLTPRFGQIRVFATISLDFFAFGYVLGIKSLQNEINQIRLCLSSHFIANAPSGIRNQ